MPDTAAIIERFGAHAVDGALAQLRGAEEWQTIERVVPVPLSRVLCENWNERRMEQCREKLAAGSRAPVIILSGYRLALRRPITLWSVSDGNHRAVAAREAGRRRIGAKVSGAYRLDFSEHVINDEGLWRRKAGGWWSFLGDLSDTQTEILRAFGVPQAGQGTPRTPA